MNTNPPAQPPVAEQVQQMQQLQANRPKIGVGSFVIYKRHPGDGSEIRPAIVTRLSTDAKGKVIDGSFHLHVLGVPPQFAQLEATEGDDCGQFTEY